MKQRYSARASNGVDVQRVYTEAYSEGQARLQLMERGKKNGYDMVGEVFLSVSKPAPVENDHVGYLNIYKDDATGNLKSGGLYKTVAGADSVAKPHRFRRGIVVWD